LPSSNTGGCKCIYIGRKLPASEIALLFLLLCAMVKYACIIPTGKFDYIKIQKPHIGQF